MGNYKTKNDPPLSIGGATAMPQLSIFKVMPFASHLSQNSKIHYICLISHEEQKSPRTYNDRLIGFFCTI